ncbi:MAG: deoxyribodipyrimidine photo-lyase, partial [Pseudomonadota bacterium]
MADASIMWFRRDLRLSDNRALLAACKAGGPVIPLFICDEVVETLGTAPAWRLGLGVEHLSAALEGMGSKLIFRRGDALSVMKEL